MFCYHQLTSEILTNSSPGSRAMMFRDLLFKLTDRGEETLSEEEKRFLGF